MTNRPIQSTSLPITMDIQPLDSILGSGNYRRIAKGVGVYPQHVSRFLKGRTGASWDVACRIADVAGVTMNQLREYRNSQQVKEKAA